jgi:adenylosuccinate lyase
MRANIESSNGAVFAERVTMLLIPSVGREAATRFVIEALGVSRESGKTFREALLGMPDITRVIPADQLRTIDTPEDYLGVAETLRVRLLNREPSPLTAEL